MAHLERLVGEGKLAWADLELAGMKSDEPLEERAKGRSALERYLARCGEFAPEALGIAKRYLDASLWNGFGKKLRTWVESTRASEAWRDHQALWEAEFRFTPPQDHAAVRERVRADLIRLRSMVSPPDTVLLDFFELAYRLADDPDGERWVFERRLAADPCGRKTLEVRIATFDAAHPVPRSGAVEAWIDRDRAFLGESRRWLEACPTQETLRIKRLRALAGLPESAPEDVLREVREYLMACEEQGGLFCTSPFVRIQAVEFLAFRRVGISEATALLTRVKADERAGGISCPDLNGASCWQVARAEFRLELARRELGAARSRLEAMEKSSASLGRESAATEEQGRREDQLRESELLGLRGELAEASGSSGDAVRFYRAAMRAGDQDNMRLRHARLLMKEVGAVAEDRTGGGASAGAPTRSARGGVATAPRGDRGTAGEGKRVSRWDAVDAPFELAAVTDTTGRQWSATELRGKTVLVSFWATWCAPCRAELAFVQALHERLADLGSFQVVTINLDENLGVVAPFAKANRWTFPVLWGFDEFSSELASGLPLTWIVDARGRVVRRTTGFPTDGSVDWVEESRAEMETVSRSAGGSSDR